MARHSLAFCNKIYCLKMRSFGIAQFAATPGGGLPLA